MNLVANARMYAVTPEAAVARKQMFSWLSNHSGVPLEIVDHASPAPLEEFWSRHDLGCAFMCGFPFAKSSPRLTAAAAPIPSDARYGGCSVYSTELVVRADSKCRILDETFGGRVGFTVDHSHSGFDALRHHLLHLRSAARSALYATSVGPLLPPRKS
jgi:ABC-type phosphate/phosphonate transport system substrate-binding protein